MNKRIKTLRTSICAISILVLSAGCDSGNNSTSNGGAASNASALASATTSPVNVLSEYVQRDSSARPASSGDNLFNNGDFEGGLESWSSCGADALELSSEAYTGQSSLQVKAGDCIYQTLEIPSADSLVASCYARLMGNPAWTGMGLGLWDENWEPISESPATLISGTGWNRYDARLSVPDRAAYISMWFYSETDALLDTCVLSPASEAPEPPIETSDNLLENADFSDSTNGVPAQWQSLCAGAIESVEQNETSELLVYDGACALQSLSASDLQRMQGNVFELACELEFDSAMPRVDQWATISLVLDGQEESESIHTADESRVRLTVLGAETITNGFVSIYNENEKGSLRVSRCSLEEFDSGIGENTVDPADNLLFNGNFALADANSKPEGWTKVCNDGEQAGSWEVVESPFSEGALELKGDSNRGTVSCIKQYLAANKLEQLSNNTFTLSCDAWNRSGDSGSAWVDMRYDNFRSHRMLIEPTGYFEPFVLSDRIEDITFMEVQVWGTDVLVDNCVLEATGEASRRYALDVRVNIEGFDVYAVNRPYTFDIAMANTGDTQLTDLSFDADNVDCNGSITVLEAGEELIQSCFVDEPFVENRNAFFFTVTATATAPNGVVISDTDSAGYESDANAAFQSIRLSVKAKKPTVLPGEDAVFVVSTAMLRGTLPITEITSDHPACAKTYSPPLTIGQYDIYECTIPGIQTTTSVNIQLQNRDETATVFVGSQ